MCLDLDEKIGIFSWLVSICEYRRGEFGLDGDMHLLIAIPVLSNYFMFDKGVL